MKIKKEKTDDCAINVITEISNIFLAKSKYSNPILVKNNVEDNKINEILVQYLKIKLYKL